MSVHADQQHDELIWFFTLALKAGHQQTKHDWHRPTINQSDWS
jgi:hypothetical protein